MRVLCAGHVNWDVTICVDSLPGPDGECVVTDQSQAGGGSAANTAAALAGLDVETGLLGSVGVDEHGLLVRRELSSAGVDCDLVTEVPGETTVKYLVVDDDGEVMVLANDGVNESFGTEDLNAETLATLAHVHLTGQSPATAAALARRARAAGVTVSLDPGRRVCDRDFSDAAACADYLFLNDREEACAPDSLFDAFEGTIVVKNGTDGGSVFDHSGERTAGTTAAHTHPGYDVNPVDTAGAGDAFAAGFLAATLDGADDDEALAVANACGALASRDLGARTDLDWSSITDLRQG